MKKSMVLTMALLSVTAAQAAEFTLKSKDVEPEAKLSQTHVYNAFGCTGNNMSPQLSWGGAPAGTKSFALTVFDPDAPTGSGWWHWVLVDLPANTMSLPGGAGASDGKALPKGSRHIRTDFGTLGYGGPCPPVGDESHRYVFTLYALSVPNLADLADDATAAMAGFMIRANSLGQATFTVTYGR